MKKDKHTIIAIHLHQRTKQALQVQKIFTEYGASIRTRLGLHEIGDEYNAPGGVIILEMTGKNADIQSFVKKLNRVKGLEIKKIVFDHD